MKYDWSGEISIPKVTDHPDRIEKTSNSYYIMLHGYRRFNNTAVSYFISEADQKNQTILTMFEKIVNKFVFILLT